MRAMREGVETENAMATFTLADIGRRVICRFSPPETELAGVLVGLTALMEFVVVRFDGDDRDEAASSEMVRFVDEGGAR